MTGRRVLGNNREFIKQTLLYLFSRRVRHNAYYNDKRKRDKNLVETFFILPWGDCLKLDDGDLHDHSLLDP